MFQYLCREKQCLITKCVKGYTMYKTITIKPVYVSLILLLSQNQNILAQAPQRPASNALAEVRRLSAEDHQRMMDLLGIKSLRPGRNGMDPNAPNLR